MFLGTYHHQVDSKGRVAVPAAFRRDLAEGSVIAIGPEGRLMIYPPSEWSDLEQRYRRTSATAAEERELIRLLFGYARPAELDGQGRLLLTQEHRDFAKIGDRAVFTGVGNVVEVVGEEIWEALTAALDADSFTELHDRVNQPASAPST